MFDLSSIGYCLLICRHELQKNVDMMLWNRPFSGYFNIVFAVKNFRTSCGVGIVELKSRTYFNSVSHWLTWYIIMGCIESPVSFSKTVPVVHLISCLHQCSIFFNISHFLIHIYFKKSINSSRSSFININRTMNNNLRLYNVFVNW